MDWTNIIVTLITSGAFTAIYFLGDRKTSQVLDNVSKTIDQWKGIVDEVKSEAEVLRAEMKQMKMDYAQRMQVKDNKIDSLYKEISVFRDRNDKLSSNVARLTVVRCWRMECGKRQPPLGKQVKTEEDAVVIEQIEMDNGNSEQKF